MNLTEIRQKIFVKKIVLVFIFFFAIVLVVFLLTIRPGKKYEIKEVPQAVDQQPIKDGKFDKEAAASQKSKAEIERIKNKLPKREEFRTSTNTTVSYTIFYKPLDPFSLYVETVKINPLISPQDPDFPKQVLNFREAAARVLSFLDDQGVEINSVYIIWGSGAMQKAAETLLKESPEYPKVVKNGDKWVFETTPTSPQPSTATQE